MAVGLLQIVTLIVSTCSKHVSRAARKLQQQGDALSRFSAAGVFSLRSNVVPLGDRRSKRTLTRRSKKRDVDEEAEAAAEVEEMEAGTGEGVWRRTILMGEKCQPLDFSGVIYYDSDGRRLSEIPTPLSPMRSPLHYSLASSSRPVAGIYDRAGDY